MFDSVDDVEVRAVFEGLIEAIPAYMESSQAANEAATVKNCLIAADLASKNNWLDIQQAMLVRARRTLGIGQA